eukprot:Protomagalhaensia_sp_Gyna_25__2934@NODE_2720_length_926_cov_824_621195_g2268_i0_p1_GENE_NODE_2720_length_926_cov_824_621195_g2268_i0NODE_2720_length_926_cov_824_621195_g2268_i0_p1_ORF_typecomplete_len100_score13_09LSM/PF01423_22/5_9e18_NODE_2720_length_926_cov_824_621195_g2268_i047346
MPLAHINEPMDLIKLSLDERILVKSKGGRELYGRLHAFDPHMNLIISDVLEIISTKTLDPVTGKETQQRTERRIEMLFVRGDGIMLISPLKSSPAYHGM